MSIFKHIKQLYPTTNNEESTKLLKVFWLLLTFTVFSGAIRKWVFAGGAIGNVIFLLQLFLPLVFYILVMRNKLPKLRLAPVIWLLYVFYAFLSAINPMNHTIFHGIFGIVLHTGYFLVWLAYLQKGQWMELEKLVPFFLIILAVELILAILQYALPGTHVLNIQASGDSSSAIVGDAIRVSGTFSYIGGYQVFVPFFACLVWFMMLKGYKMGLVMLVLGSGLLMALLSGSRSAVGFYILYLTMAFLQSGNIGGRVFKGALQGILILSLITLLMPALQNTISRSYDNFLNRVENSDQVDERISNKYTEIFNFRGQYPVFGVGLGATYQGANALFGTSLFVKQYGGFENELARIILEGGYVLFFLRLITLLVFLKQTPHLPLMAKVFLFVVFFNTMITFNIFQGIFYVLGIILIDRGYFLKQQKERANTNYNRMN